jgi:hypothetical protein
LNCNVEGTVAKRGRPGLGVGHVERLDGADESKHRLEVILRTVAGELTVEQACDELGIGAAQFHRLREQALSGALAALEPRPAGRPPNEPAGASRVEQLEEQVRELEIDLRASQLREEIAVAMPHLLKPKASASEKKTAKNRERRQRQRRRKTK